MHRRKSGLLLDWIIQNVTHKSFQIRFDEAVIRTDRGDFSSEGRHAMRSWAVWRSGLEGESVLDWGGEDGLRAVR